MPGDHFELNFVLVLLPVYETEVHDITLTMNVLDPYMYMNVTLTMKVDYRNSTVATVGKIGQGYYEYTLHLLYSLIPDPNVQNDNCLQYDITYKRVCE